MNTYGCEMIVRFPKMIASLYWNSTLVCNICIIFWYARQNNKNIRQFASSLVWKCSQQLTICVRVKNILCILHEKLLLLFYVLIRNIILIKNWIYLTGSQLQCIHTLFVHFCVFFWYGTCQFKPVSFRVASLALGQSYDCPSASEAALKNMGKCTT